MSIFYKILIGFGVVAVVLIVGYGVAKYRSDPLYSVPEDPRVLGSVVSAGGESVDILVYGPSAAEGEVETRTFAVAPEVPIVRQVLYPREQFEAELKAFQSGATTTVPVPFYDKQLALGDLKKGMMLTITPDPVDASRATHIMVIADTPLPPPSTPPPLP